MSSYTIGFNKNDGSGVVNAWKHDIDAGETLP